MIPFLKFALSYVGSISIGLKAALVHGGIGRCGDNRYPGIYVRVDSPDVLPFIKGEIGADTRGGDGGGGPSSASDVDIPRGSEGVYLHYSAANGNASIARQLLRGGLVDADTLDGGDGREFLRTPLITAANT